MCIVSYFLLKHMKVGSVPCLRFNFHVKLNLTAARICKDKCQDTELKTVIRILSYLNFAVHMKFSQRVG